MPLSPSPPMTLEQIENTPTKEIQGQLRRLKQRIRDKERTISTLANSGAVLADANKLACGTGATLADANKLACGTGATLADANKDLVSTNSRLTLMVDEASKRAEWLTEQLSKSLLLIFALLLLSSSLSNGILD